MNLFPQQASLGVSCTPEPDPEQVLLGLNLCHKTARRSTCVVPSLQLSLSLSCSWFRSMHCANVRVSSPLKVFALAGASTMPTHSCSPSAPSVGLEGQALLSPCLREICPFSLGFCGLFFDV